MSVWLTIPSKRPPEQVNPLLDKWRAQGYKIALLRERDDVESDLCQVSANYEGYAHSVNWLIQLVRGVDREAQWFIAAGDDVEPDLNHSADKIAGECNAHFDGTFGVMQPTGDRWGERPNHPNPQLRGAYIDRVCGSAWIGLEFVRRAYDGNGPLWSEYFHMFADEELQAVAAHLGVLWQRRDLIQLHKHWGRRDDGKMAHAHDMPEFLHKANSPAEWDKAQALFRRRAVEGFPGSGVTP